MTTWISRNRHRLAGIAAMFATLFVPSTTAVATGAQHAGKQTRAVSSLSAADVAQLQRGAGWGFALPAELNGYPGPMHVLELASQLKLTAEQKKQVTRIFDRMQTQAQALGAQFIASEKALDALFKSERATLEALARQVAASADLGGQLRATHLAAHLAVTPLLSAEQLQKYAQLRGYAGRGAPHSGRGPGHENGQENGHDHGHNHGASAQ